MSWQKNPRGQYTRHYLCNPITLQQDSSSYGELIFNLGFPTAYSLEHELFAFHFIFGHTLWHVEVTWPGIKPTPQRQPAPQMQQRRIFNLLHHQEASQK